MAIEKANGENEELNLHGVAVAIEPNNAFETSKKLCKMLRVCAREVEILFVVLHLIKAPKINEIKFQNLSVK